MVNMGHSETFVCLPHYQASTQDLSAALLVHQQCLGISCTVLCSCTGGLGFGA